MSTAEDDDRYLRSGEAALEKLLRAAPPLDEQDWNEIEDARVNLLQVGTDDADELVTKLSLSGSDAVGLHRHPSDSIDWMRAVVDVCSRHTEAKWQEVRAAALGLMAEAHNRLGEVSAAVACYEDALRLVPPDSEFGVGLRHNFAVMLFHVPGRLDEAERLLQSGLDAARKAGDHRALGLHLGNLSAYSGLTGNIESMLSYARDSRDAAIKAADPYGEIVALHLEASALAELGDPSAALPLFERAIEFYRVNHHRRDTGRLQGDYGKAFLALGRIDDALQCFEESLEVAREHNDMSAAATAMNNISVARSMSHTAAPAGEQSWRDSLEAANVSHIPHLQALAHYNIGTVAIEKKDWATAREELAAALSFARASRDAATEVAILTNQAGIALETGERTALLPIASELLAAVERLGDRKAAFEAMRAVGDILSRGGHRSLAIRLLAHAFQLAEQLKDPQSAGDTLMRLGYARQRSGDIDHAIRTFGQALALAQPLGDYETVSMVLFNLSMCHAAVGRRLEAQQAITAAVAVARGFGSSQVDEYKRVLAAIEDPLQWAWFTSAAQRDAEQARLGK